MRYSEEYVVAKALFFTVESEWLKKRENEEKERDDSLDSLFSSLRCSVRRFVSKKTHTHTYAQNRKKRKDDDDEGKYESPPRPFFSRLTDQ